MSRIFLFSLIACIVIFIVGEFAACKDTQTGPKEDIVFPDSNISFSQHVGPLFQQKCAAGLCHSGNNPAGSLNLEYPGSYNELLAHSGLVIPGDGIHSELVLHLQGILILMPPAGKLSDNQINGIRKWIDEGAKNN
jgi:hypothetical protein